LIIGVIALVVGTGIAVGGEQLGAATHRDRAMTIAYFEESQVPSMFASTPAPTAWPPATVPAIMVWVDGTNYQSFSLWVVREEPDRIVVTAREPSTQWQMALIQYPMIWPLSRPVGTRQVIDGSTGKVVPRKGQR
jgi:hypothetical protein